MVNPPIPPGLSNQPYYVRSHKDWAVEQEIYRHDQALYSIGELSIFILLWGLDDFNHGYTSRCSRCYGYDLDGRSAEIYNQANKAKCPRCYGTTFEGGIRARIIRPALFTSVDPDDKQKSKGVTHPVAAMVESTSDFRFRSGDFVFRNDGSRWQLASPTRVSLRTGFEHPGQVTSSIGYTQGPAKLEDATSVAYLIPPSPEELLTTLAPTGNYPPVTTDLINAPLIPNGVTD